jgi:hypothetical protein
MKLPEAIDLISQLPYIPEWYEPETRPAKEQIERLKHRYRCISYWLNDLMLDGEEPDYSTNPELLGYFPPAIHLQRLYELIKATDRVSSWKIDRVYLWVMCAVSDSEWLLKQKGITSLLETGVASPSISSKTDLLKYRTEAIKKYDLDNSSPATQVTFSSLAREEANEWLFLHLRNWVEGEAFKLAKQNTTLKKLYWQPYLATFEELNNIIRESEEFQLSYLMPDGTQIITAKHLRLPKGYDSEIRSNQLAKRKEKKTEILQNRYKNG